MDRKKPEEELDDTEIRRDTQVRGSLGQPPSGLTDDEWCEEVVDCDRPSSTPEDDDRISER